MEFKIYKNLEEFFKANQNAVFRYWIYKKMFTPYEQEQKFEDESIFTDLHAYFGRVQSVIPLPNGDFLLGILGTENNDYVHYYKLSEIHIEFYEGDQVNDTQEAHTVDTQDFYVVIKAVERNVGIFSVRSSLKEAQNAMEEDYILHLKKHDTNQKEVEDSGEGGISEISAWSDCGNVKVDWRIIKLPKEEG